MRAVLIVNPNATSTTPAGRDLLAHALESRVKLTVVHTDHRGHAIDIAREATRDGTDVVIVHGGDGTVNEVVNGLLGDCGQAPPKRGPAISVVPGGSANVFARALGISPDPIEATNQLVDLLGAYRRGVKWRRIGLMDCGDRWGVFTAGMGVDGDVVAAVEAQREKGRKVTASRYIRVATREVLASARREPSMTLETPWPRPHRRCALRVRVQRQPVDLRGRPASVDEPEHQLRDGPGRLRHHQHERLGERWAGAADAGQETAPRRRASGA